MEKVDNLKKVNGNYNNNTHNIIGGGAACCGDTIDFSAFPTAKERRGRLCMHRGKQGQAYIRSNDITR